ncbi:hypothetical protein P175DRAFT_0536264 [Aspergillus ochraceoroseus IBT 24754]|uniref:Uncharacterized protein n=1 Tax=Aspergillus ochraceoroseus IBT 24754 TaxID=1392256 RepID=A0A2T5LL97_9EURO|nr:uncharacterized protein P175DRAFT_0536264 [Aspergillus ochraceoroseus IBT 24754]PTU17061.1 hypothetical protein P175DRAFT_0536264 [Aspergillus ochraceoroseus IBT 24754]
MHKTANTPVIVPGEVVTMILLVPEMQHYCILYRVRYCFIFTSKRLVLLRFCVEDIHTRRNRRAERPRRQPATPPNRGQNQSEAIVSPLSSSIGRMSISDISYRDAGLPGEQIVEVPYSASGPGRLTAAFTLWALIMIAAAP